jgi:hypothetical protein
VTTVQLTLTVPSLRVRPRLWWLPVAWAVMVVGFASARPVERPVQVERHVVWHRPIVPLP